MLMSPDMGRNSNFPGEPKTMPLPNRSENIPPAVAKPKMFDY
jgi:hypothetical protein